MRKLIGLLGVSALVIMAGRADAKGMYAGIKGGVNYVEFPVLFVIRYSQGFTNIVDAEGSDTRNSGIGVMAGLQFPLGAK